MDFIFVLGVGRSGTTWLSDLISLTCSPIKYIDEPFPKMKNHLFNKFADKRFYRPWFLPFNADEVKIKIISQFIDKLAFDNKIFKPRFLSHALKFEDTGYKDILLKDVHNLGVYPHLVNSLTEDFKVVVITRETKQVLDSTLYHFGLPKRNSYLQSEYEFIRSCLQNKSSTGNKYVDEVLCNLPNPMLEYIKKKFFIKRDRVKKRAIITEIIKRKLENWAQDDPNVMHVTHEELCENTIDLMKKIYNYIELPFDRITENKIIEKSTGINKGKFDTTKNSLTILQRDYRVLDDKMLKQLDQLGI